MKIGFIDYYLDNWHASQLTEWLPEFSDGKVHVAYAYGEENAGDLACTATERSNRTWVEEQSRGEYASRFEPIKLLDTPEEVIDQSDALMVLSPNNPEQHEHLAKLALASGKPVYIDKTFAPDSNTAKRMIDRALLYKTPMFTSSSLRFSKELRELSLKDIQSVGTRGNGPFEIYIIHQIEIAVSLLGADPKRVLLTSAPNPTVLVDFGNNRSAVMQQCAWTRGSDYDVAINNTLGDQTVYIPSCTDFFPEFVRLLIRFFETGESPVPFEETMAVMKIRQAALRAMETPGEWVKIDE